MNTELECCDVGSRLGLADPGPLGCARTAIHWGFTRGKALGSSRLQGETKHGLEMGQVTAGGAGYVCWEASTHLCAGDYSLHRITESFGLEGSLKQNQFQAPCCGQRHFPLDQVAQGLHGVLAWSKRVNFLLPSGKRAQGICSAQLRGSSVQAESCFSTAPSSRGNLGSALAS